MYLSQPSNMFTGTASGENNGEIKDEAYVSDLGFGIKKLSVSPTPFDGSSASMMKEKISDADLLLPALDAISMIEHPAGRVDTAADVIDAEASESIGLYDLFALQHDEWKDGIAFESSDLASKKLLGMQSEGQTKLLVETDQTCDRNHPPVSCTAYGICTTINIQDQNKDSLKLSKIRRKASKNSVFDLASLNILRRNRSLSSKPARSSIWGSEVQIIPDSWGLREQDLKFGSQKTLKKVGGGKGKSNTLSNLRGKKSTSRNSNAPKSQTGRKSSGKNYPTVRPISLKVKIGNQSCCIANANENFIASGKEIPELLNKTNCKFGENRSGDSIRDLEKVMLSENCAPSEHVNLGRDSNILSLKTSGGFHQTMISKDGENFGTSSENRFSDVGTSPDSEVINSVPDAPHCEKGLPGTQGSPVTSNACASHMDFSNSVIPKKTPKQGKKKDKLHQLGNSTVGKLTGEEITNSAELANSLGDFSDLSTLLSKSRKGKKKSKPCQVGRSGVGSKPVGTESTDNVEVTPGRGGGHTLGDVSDSDEAARIISKNPHLSCMGKNFSSAFEAPIASATAQEGDLQEGNGQKSPKLSGAKGGNKVWSKISSPRSKNEKASKKKGNKNIVDDQHQSSENVSPCAVHIGVASLLESGNQIPFGVGEAGDITKDLTGPRSSLHYSSDTVMAQHTVSRKAWVLCDDCQKWRRIPAALADQVEHCGWTCKDNMDKEFADCSVPQEKSNSEINEELEISDGSGEEDASDTFLKSNHNDAKVAEQSSWSLIKSNLFQHRRRKTQTIDEVMVCHCKPQSDGRMGCGAKCLNRMLNIECVRGTCPCGDLCSNQQFQKRKYSKLKWFRCGKKGYGLEAVEGISEGQFLIEYVGEVLDMHTYEARQREYAMKGHKHFYFMTLNGSEVIDACAKGNLGRFINHSCEPNCRTEKWMVNGEVCVGLFALRNIKKGEEVTFDYNYVRVFGAAAKKCVCGSPNCRGYIGGDPKNTEQIVQDDSDDEFKEPVMICEDREMNGDWNDIMSNCLKSGEREVVKEPPSIKNRMKKLVGAAGISAAEPPSIEKVEGADSVRVIATVDGERLEVEGPIEKDFAVNVEQSSRSKVSRESFSGTVTETCKVESQGLEAHLHSSPQSVDWLLSDDIFSKFKSSACERPSTAATPSESLSEPPESKRRFSVASLEVKDEPAKPSSLVKTKYSSLAPRKGTRQIKAVKEKRTPELDKLNATSEKSKNMVEFSLNGHFEAVEEKLNELLDPEGGISKRKDASRGYLKLLFLTAASENNGHGEAIQSNRDLSMILDALLKTKSRTVLVDVINKNGLQMLHNIMKRYRKEFIKTPILRKLLKVLEYLAMREILTLEHITGGPPRPGVESFKDSILTLTEHVDKQVHQIARSFRDRWIPKPLRRNCRDDGRIELHNRPAHGSVLGSSSYLSDKSGKPSEVLKPGEFQSVTASVTVGTSSTLGVGVSPALGSSSATNGTIRKRKSRWDTPAEDYPHSRTRTNLMIGDDKMSVDDDIPPGFSSPLNVPILPSNPTSVVSNPQEKDTLIKQSLLSRIVSYPPGDEKMTIDEDLPPGFSSPCNAPLVTNGPSAAINHQEVEIHSNQHHQDSRTTYSLAGDEKMNTSEDIPPGFSSRCNALMVPSGPSSSSIKHQDQTRHYQHSSPRSNYEGDERMKSDDDIPPGFASSGGHAAPSVQAATDINHQKRYVHAQKYMHSQTVSNMTVDDDAPPGFSSLCNGSVAVPGTPSIAVNLQKRKMDTRQDCWNVVCGESQLKFMACKPLAYGISYSAVQQFGVLKAEGWSTAPGVPFHPFPPLPPYGSPKDQRVSIAACPPSVEGLEKSEESRTSSTYPPGQNYRGTWSLENNPSVADDRSEFQQGGSYNLGRKFFRQQKCYQPKTAPPWVRMRNGWGYAGATARNGVPGVVLGNGANEHRNSYS